jgi:hypothetical protein
MATSESQDAANIAASASLYVGQASPVVQSGDNISELVNDAGYGTNEVISSALVGLPDNTWDSADTGGYGISFSVGAFVIDEDTGLLYICQDATPSSAIWVRVMLEKL